MEDKQRLMELSSVHRRAYGREQGAKERGICLFFTKKSLVITQRFRSFIRFMVVFMGIFLLLLNHSLFT